MTKPAEAEQSAPKRGIGTVAIESIVAGRDNEEALADVKKEFPDAKTSLSSINWYRNKLRSEKVKGVLTARELKKKKASAVNDGRDPLA